MTVVVTGASGHIGANLVRALLRRGEHVRVLDYEDTGSLHGLRVERVEGDVRDVSSLRLAFEGAETLYHLAGVISIDGDRNGLLTAVNVEGARNAAKAALARGVRRMVHFCSVHAFVHEPITEPLDEQRARVPQTGGRFPSYDRSKAAGERQVREVIAQGLDAVIVHPSGVIGPNDFAPSRIGRAFLGWARGSISASVAGGFDWVDVRDVVNGAIAAASRGRRGESYILGGAWRSVRELAILACRAAGVKAPQWTAPMWLARMAAPPVALVSRVRRADPLFTPESLHALRGSRRVCSDKAKRELGYEHRPLEETVRDIYAAFAQSGILERRIG